MQDRTVTTVATRGTDGSTLSNPFLLRVSLAFFGVCLFFAGCEGLPETQSPDYQTTAQPLGPHDAGHGEIRPGRGHCDDRKRRGQDECPDGEPINACASCGVLDAEPGDVCGLCGVGVITCDDDGGVFCEGDEPSAGDVLCAVAAGDTYVRAERRNRNFGWSQILRVRRTGNNRALVYFDSTDVEELVDGQPIISATLQLSVVRNDRRWGRQGRTLDLHAVTVPWTEMNATWACAIDSRPWNWRRDCWGETRWEMAKPYWSELHPWMGAPTDTVLVDNHTSGVISFDVTDDLVSVLAGELENNGWLVRKTQENRSGRLDFGSRESHAPPVLLIELDTCSEPNACGGCEPLDREPGVVCGPCGLDAVVCDGTDATTCDGSTTVNACDGCGALANEPGAVCGPCDLDVYACDGTETTVCDGSTTGNACGGCGTLTDEPGAACGPCDLDSYVCDGTDG